MYVNYIPVLRPIFVAVKLIRSRDHFLQRKEKKRQKASVCKSEEMTFPLKQLYVILFGTITHVFTSSALYFYNIVAKHRSISTADSSAPEFIKAPLLLLCRFCGCQIYF